MYYISSSGQFKFDIWEEIMGRLKLAKKYYSLIESHVNYINETMSKLA